MNSLEGVRTKGTIWGMKNWSFRDSQREKVGGKSKAWKNQTKKSKTQKETECNRRLLTFALIHQTLADSSVRLLLFYSPTWVRSFSFHSLFSWASRASECNYYSYCLNHSEFMLPCFLHLLTLPS